MSWLATAGLIFGKTLAKSLVKYWLGDGFVNDFLGEGIDKSSEQVSAWIEKPNIEATIARIAQNLKPIFEKEGSSLEEASKKSVVFSVATVFADIDSALLVKLNLDANELQKHVLNTYPNQTRDFSRAEESFYNTMLDQICQAVVKLAPKLDAFDYSWTSEFLKDQDKLISLVDQLMKVPNEADIRFEKKYRQAVTDELDIVDYLGIGKIDDITHRQSLSVSYVSLQASTGNDLVDEFSNKQSAKLLDKRRKHFSSSDNLSGDVEQILASGSRFVIRGEAGAGKTTLVHWLAVRAANKDFPSTLASWNGLLPFVIHLRDYSKSEEAFPKPEDFPIEVAEMALGEMPSGWVHRQLDSQRSLILIDGVDELPYDRRNKMLERLKQLVNLYPFNHYIITSRPTALKSQDWTEWEMWVEDEEFIELSFQPMDIQRIEMFISQWHKALYLSRMVRENDSISLSDGLKRIINRRSDLMKLAEAPLLCAMLCALHHDRRDSLPSDRRQLYKECIEILVERRDVKRDINLGIPLNIESKIKLLRYLAYWMLDNQYVRIETKICDEKFIQKASSLPKAKGVTGKDIRVFFVERSNLLRESVVGQIEFVHRSFQEYLAAQYAVLDERNFGALVKNSKDDQWRDVIILAIGEVANTEDRDYLLDEILKLAYSPQNKKVRNKLCIIAAAGLDQSIESPSPEIEQKVMNALAELVPPQTWDDAEMLAIAGSRVLPYLVYDNKYDDVNMQGRIAVLSKIGSKEALNLLRDYTEEKDLVIVRNLSMAWDDFDRKEYADKILSNYNILIKPTPLKSWDGFEFLHHLEEILIVCDYEINDISILQNCRRLRRLGIIWDHLFNLEQLSFIEGLTELSVGHWASSHTVVTHEAPLSNISLIGKMQSLRVLCIFSRNLKDITPLRNLSNLGVLKIASKRIENLDVINELVNLEELAIGATPTPDINENAYSYLEMPLVKKLPSLSNLPNLKKITLGYLNIENLESIRSIRGLKYLMLSNLKNIQDFALLATLENIEELHLDSLELSDVGFLSSMANLKKLYISNTKINEIKAFSKLKLLSELYIYNSPVKDLSPIESLSNLQKVVIDRVPANKLKINYPLEEFIFNPSTAIFFEIYAHIDNAKELSFDDKRDIKAEIEEVEDAFGEESPDENFILRRLRNVKRMMPQIAEFAIETLKNPNSDMVGVITNVERRLYKE